MTKKTPDKWGRPSIGEPTLGEGMKQIIAVLILGMGVSLAGCSIKSDLTTHLSNTIVNNNDLKMVESGAPAYLLMVDSLISQDPDSQEILATASRLYSAYADVFVSDPDRSKKMSDKALGYAERSMCLAFDAACDLRQMPYEAFKSVLGKMDGDELPALYTLGTSWAGWIMAHRDDFNALADMARIEDIMKRVIQLDETYQDGSAYLYLGALSTLLPPALGWKPEQGRAYFEKALVLSQGKNFMVRVMYAQLYAKIVFDRDLHDRLLREVIQADPQVPGYVWVNTYAQERAQKLLEAASDYF